MTGRDLMLVFEHAEHGYNGKWSLGGGPFHTTEQALLIIKACLMLDVRVTDAITSQAWYALVSKVTELEKRAQWRL
jgi:hypothetical protein